MQVDLEIGGYGVRLTTPQGLAAHRWPLKAYEPFLSAQAHSPGIDVRVHVVRRLPEIPHGPLIFDACHGLWRLFHGESGPVLEALDTKTRVPRSRSVISPDFSQVDTWLLEQRRRGTQGWLPMHILNPIAEVCLLTRLGREGGVLLHSAGVLVQEEGWIFTGRSGAGKSTISGLLAARGGAVLSDERMIVRRRGPGFVLYGTPWVGSAEHASNRTGRLTRLFCIRHGEGRHRLHGMTPRASCQFILQQCFLPHWDQEAMQGVLSTVGDLVESVDCADLAFLKDASLADFLQQPAPATPVMGAA